MRCDITSTLECKVIDPHCVDIRVIIGTIQFIAHGSGTIRLRSAARRPAWRWYNAPRTPHLYGVITSAFSEVAQAREYCHSEIVSNISRLLFDVYGVDRALI